MAYTIEVSMYFLNGTSAQEGYLVPFNVLEVLRGHSMSLKLVQFESLDAVSYSPSVVTTAVSVAVCEIFTRRRERC